MKKRMVALKPFRYGTRALDAGDVFFAQGRQVRLLETVKRARPYVERAPAVVEPPKVPLAVPDIDALRDKARSVGLKVDGRWSAETLAKKIEEADEDVGGAS
jgi:hypothetical protein